MLKEQINSNACIELIGGIIWRAIEDIADSDPKIQKSAKRFLNSDELDYCCSVIGVPVNFIFNKAGIKRSDLVGTESKNTKPSAFVCKDIKDMTPEELREYRATYRREYNAKNPDRVAAYNAKRKARRKALQQSNQYSLSLPITLPTQ